MEMSRRTIHIALKDIGYKRPYPLEGGVDNTERSASLKRADNRVQEFVWAFGADAETEMEKQIMRQIEHLKETKNVEELLHGSWSHMEELDLDEWLEHLEESFEMKLCVFPEKMNMHWHRRWNSIGRKSMNGLPENIRSWLNGSGNADISWMST